MKNTSSSLRTNNTELKNAPPGALVELCAPFKTANGTTYPKGATGRKTMDYEYGSMVEMTDNAVIPIPFESVALEIPVRIIG